MAVTHVVLLQFKATTEPEIIKAVCTRFLDIGQACVHPETQIPYVLSVNGGKNLGLVSTQGDTYVFVLEFASMGDCEYYMAKDPAHRAFTVDVKPLLEKLTVLDFVPGEL